MGSEKEEERENNIESVDFISGLPNSIIHRIYSHIPWKEATRTSVLSKAWNKTWYSYPRPQYDFRFNSSLYKDEQEFLNSVNTSVHKLLVRHLDLQLLKLSVSSGEDSKLPASLIQQWISMAVEKKVPKLQLDFSLSSGYHVYTTVEKSTVPDSKLVLDFSIYSCGAVNRLGFPAECLSILSLASCKFKDMPNVKLPQLRKLRVHGVSFTSQGSLQQYICACCHTVEHLEVTDCKIPDDVLVLCLPELKDLLVYGFRHEGTGVDISAPNLHTLSIRSKLFGPLVLDKATFSSLRVLRLIYSPFRSIEPSTFEHLISKLPAIEKFQLVYSPAVEMLKISSKTLKKLELSSLHPSAHVLKVIIDTPNLTSINFSGLIFPSFSMSTPRSLQVQMEYYPLVDNQYNPHHNSFIERFSDKMKFIDLFNGIISHSDCKLIFHDYMKGYAAIHEKLSEASHNFLQGSRELETARLRVSSKSYSDIINELLNHRYETLSVVCASQQPIEILMKIMKEYTSRGEALYRFALGTYEEVEQRMHPGCKSFLKSQLTGSYRAATFTLKWHS